MNPPAADRPSEPVDDLNRPCHLIILPNRQSVRRDFDWHIRIDAIRLETTAFRGEPAEDRQAQPIATADPKVGCPEDVAARFLPDDACQPVLGRKTGHHLGSAVGPFVDEDNNPVVKRLFAQTLREEHDRFVAEREASQCDQEFPSAARHGDAWECLRIVPLPETTRREAVANSNLAGAHIARQAGESQATADISPEIDDQSHASLLFEIANRVIQCVGKSHPRGAGKVWDLKKSNVRSDLRVNRALRFDDRRALLRPFPPGNFNHNLLLTLVAAVANTQRVSMADRKIWCRGRQASCAVHGVQDISGPDPRNVGRSVFKDIQKHPFARTIQWHIPQARIDRMLWKQFFRKRVVKDSMTGLEFREKLAYSRLKRS